MKKLTISALIAVGFFASDVSANYRTSYLSSRQGPKGDFCGDFHKNVCTGGDANVPPPGKPDLCNDQACHDFIAANPDFPDCLKNAQDEASFEACFPPPPQRRRRQPGPGPAPANGTQPAGPAPTPEDFCQHVHEDQFCKDHAPAAESRRRRRQDNNANANANDNNNNGNNNNNNNGNGNNNGDDNNNHHLPNLCDLDECNAFVQDHQCVPGCLHNCKEGDDHCAEQCFAPNCGRGANNQAAQARRYIAAARRQGGQPQGPPPAAWTQEEVKDYCDQFQQKMCDADGNVDSRLRRQGEVDGQDDLPNLCDEPTCVDFIGHHNCFDNCMNDCFADPNGDCSKCLDCKDPQGNGPAPQRRRRAIRRNRRTLRH